MALPQSPFIKVYDEAFLTLLLDLIDICDSFDQIGKMARIVNILYSPGESEFYRLHEQIRSTYTHLKGLRGNIAENPGVTRRAFRAGGYDAYSFDLQDQDNG